MNLEETLNRPFKFNYRGHNEQSTRFVSGVDLKGYAGDRVRSAIQSIRLSEETNRMLTEHGGKPIERSRSDLDVFGWLSDCYVCGEELRLKPVEGKPDHYEIPHRCKYSKGIPSFDIKLKVPSGKIVFVNDRRELFDGVNDDFNINTSMGVVQTIKAYEKAGMVHFLVGNSCPGVYKFSKKKLRVATHGNGKGGRRVGGGVCTDLWWVCAVDYDNYVRMHEEKKIERPNSGFEDIVTVEPGTWAFRFDPNVGCEFTACDARHVR